MLTNTKPFRLLGMMLLFFVLFTAVQVKAAPAGYYYQIKVYHFKDKAQQEQVDAYLKDYYLPRLHKLGFKNIGVFKPVEGDTTGIRTYVFIPFKTWKDLENFDSKVQNSDTDPATGKGYIDAAYDKALYTRMETIVLSAFETRLQPALPKLTGDRAERVYELRSYESPTEKFFYNKVRMFNSGETDLFDRLGFNSVFYGSVVAGSRMPNLMYMTTFNNKADRDKHWDAFSNDAQWKDLSSRPEFQHNVSKADIIFLHPTAYSDF